MAATDTPLPTPHTLEDADHAIAVGFGELELIGQAIERWQEARDVVDIEAGRLIKRGVNINEAVLLAEAVPTDDCPPPLGLEDLGRYMFFYQGIEQAGEQIAQEAREMIDMLNATYLESVDRGGRNIFA